MKKKALISRQTILNEKSPVITPAFICMTFVNIVNKYRFPPHIHTDYEVIIVQEGKYVCLLNQHTISLAPGEILIVSPGEMHEDFCSPSLKYFSIKFIFPDFFNNSENKKLSIFRKECSKADKCLKGNDKAFIEEIRRIIADIERENNISHFSSAYIQEALLSRLFWIIIRNIPRKLLSSEFETLTREQNFVMQLTQYFKGNIHRDLRMKKVAAYMKMSESALFHKCREITGHSPAKLFKRCKIEYAANMLKNTDMSIKEISEYLNFKNPYHFSRIFKQIMQRPPSCYSAVPHKTD